MSLIERCTCGKPLDDCEQRMLALVQERDEMRRDRDSAVAGWGEAERQRQGAVAELGALFAEADYQSRQGHPSPERLREAVLRAEAWLTTFGGPVGP